MIRDITELDIYNESLRLLPKLYELLNKLPYEERDLRYQSKKAGVSIGANIAEGFAKRFYVTEFKRYLLISLASCDELISHLRTISILISSLSEESLELLEVYKGLAKRINKTHSVWRFGGKSQSDLI